MPISINFLITLPTFSAMAAAKSLTVMVSPNVTTCSTFCGAENMARAFSRKRFRDASDRRRLAPRSAISSSSSPITMSCREILPDFLKSFCPLANLLPRLSSSSPRVLARGAGAVVNDLGFSGVAATAGFSAGLSSAAAVFSRAASCSLTCSYSRVSRSISAARAARCASSAASRFLRSSSRALAAARTARNFSSAALVRLGAGDAGSSRNSRVPGATTRRRRSTKTASPFLLATWSIVTDFPSVNVAIF